MEVDDGGRDGSSIKGGGRRKGKGACFGRWAVEKVSVEGLGKRHC